MNRLVRGHRPCHGVRGRQRGLGRRILHRRPVQKHDMEIVANYLIAIEMAPMTPDMVHGPDVIHLEADVHATAENANGYPDGAWIAYPTIDYSIEKQSSSWHTGRLKPRLKPMIAKDGPHYADNVKMDGPGSYRVTYRFTAPEANGFYRHTDRETGVPGWWPSFSQTFEFAYPQK